jgi:hypothetical protein
MQGIPRDNNNWVPRAGFAWDPAGDGKMVVRGSYGLFYGHPLLAAAFLSTVVDGTKSPYLIAPHGIGADDLFQGRAFTGPLGQAIANPALGYDGTAQRYDPLSPVFSNQNTTLALSPLLAQTLPVAENLQYDSAQQATFGVERQLAPSLTLAVDYNYTHGAHLLRPRNINQGNYDLIVAYERALAVCPNLPGVSANGCVSPIYQGAGGPLSGVWDTLGGSSATSLAPLGQLIFNQFRATGPNYTWANSVSQGALSKPAMDSLIRSFGLPHASGDAVVPFFNVKQYESSGSSVYHAVTANAEQEILAPLSNPGFLDLVACHRRLYRPANASGTSRQHQHAVGTWEVKLRSAASAGREWHFRQPFAILLNVRDPRSDSQLDSCASRRSLLRPTIQPADIPR